MPPSDAYSLSTCVILCSSGGIAHFERGWGYWNASAEIMFIVAAAVVDQRLRRRKVELQQNESLLAWCRWGEWSYCDPGSLLLT